jgi:nickel-type superoxide dismutase maturation protease
MMTPSPYRGPFIALFSALGVSVAAIAIARWLDTSRLRGALMRVEVRGISMLPALAPGDRLLVCRWPFLTEGDIVAFADPDATERILVKRVTRLHAGSVEVLGDNIEASRDSRRFGAVGRRAIIGRAVWRYYPPHAAGRIAAERGWQPRKE